MVRVKSRYLLCEINVSDQSKRLLLDDRAISAAVKDAVSSAHGDYGAAQCGIGFSVKYVNAHTGILFLRCPKSSYRLIWSALPFITSVEKRGEKIPCFLNCVHVGAVTCHIYGKKLQIGDPPECDSIIRTLSEEQSEHARSSWFDTIPSSSIECSPNVKPKKRKLRFVVLYSALPRIC